MRLLTTGAAIAALLLTGASDARAERDFAWAGRVAAGQKIEVYNVNGAIRAKLSPGDAGVTATKRARRGNPESVQVKVVEHAGGLTVCAVYVEAGGECTPGRGVRGSRSINNRHNDVSVEFDVAVPAGVDVELHSVNGEVDAQGLDGDVVAETVNGSVDVSTRGVARAETVNGSVTASMGEADWTGELKMSTVNGSLVIHVPDGTGAEVKAETVNGAIESDFPLEVGGRRGPRWARGTIGGGGRQLDLSTVNGSIEIRRR